MNIDFIYNGIQYVAFDTDSEEWKSLNISDVDKATIVNEFLYEQTVKDRESAYKSESDPLYMEWQFDQTPESEQAWRDKVAEIKLRYPLTDPT